MTQRLHDTVIHFPIAELKGIPEDIRERILSVQEKFGFIPYLFLSFAKYPEEFRAYFAYHDELMEEPGNLTKVEREMIALVASDVNQRQYCAIAHGPNLRIHAKKKVASGAISENCSTAPITDRQVAMLDFAKKISQTAHLVGEKDFDLLKKFGLVEEDIWDIVGISTFFGMSNRVANISNMLGDATFSSLRH